MTNFEKVRKFMDAFGQDVKFFPSLPKDDVIQLRKILIEEETKEVIEAFDEEDLEHIAKELADLLYVVYGAGHALGLDLDLVFKEVHDSNMSKLGEDGNPVYREDGKVIKGPNYYEANIGRTLEFQGARNTVYGHPV